MSTSNIPKRVTREMMIVNRLGIHARPSIAFVKTANRFECEVIVEADGEKGNGKSIMAIQMTLQHLPVGGRFFVHTVGVDAVEAIEALDDLVKRGFGE